jgi:hypothetical protein
MSLITLEDVRKMHLTLASQLLKGQLTKMMEKLKLVSKTIKEMTKEIKSQLNDWEEKLREEEKEKEERKKREGKELKAGEKGPKEKMKEKKDKTKGKKKQSSNNTRGPQDEGLSDIHTLVFLCSNFWQLLIALLPLPQVAQESWVLNFMQLKEQFITKWGLVIPLEQLTKVGTCPSVCLRETLAHVSHDSMVSTPECTGRR